MSKAGADTYRGPDRRHRFREMASPSLGQVAPRALLLAGLTLVPVAFTLASGDGAPDAAVLEHLLGAVLGGAAGIAALVSWRVLGLAFAAWFGSALLGLGLLTLAAVRLPVVGSAPHSGAAPLEPLVVSLIAAALVALALRAPEVDAGMSPWKALGWATATGVCLVGTLGLLGPAGLLPEWNAGVGWERAEHVVIAVIWLALAGVAHRARRLRGAVPSWVPVVLALLGLTDAVRALEPTPGAWDLVAAALGAAALAMALVAFGLELSSALRFQDRQALRLRLDLERVNDEMLDERADVEERLHDLRNAVTAMRTADSILRRAAGRLDGTARADLVQAMTNELGRLRALIEPDRDAPGHDFVVAEALAGVIAVERSEGTVIHDSLGTVRARGDAAGLAQAVQNLLVNARRYAPGSPVELWAAPGPGGVELHVSDRGPGVPESDRVRVFSRGVRGATSAGTEGDGLGLFIAARLMAATGGSIRMADGEAPGAHFVIEMPAGAGRDAAPTSDPAAERSA